MRGTERVGVALVALLLASVIVNCGSTSAAVHRHTILSNRGGTDSRPTVKPCVLSTCWRDGLGYACFCSEYKR